MKFLPDYVIYRMDTRQPSITFGEIPFSEYRQWYRDYKKEYPEDEEHHRLTHLGVLG